MIIFESDPLFLSLFFQITNIQYHQPVSNMRILNARWYDDPNPHYKGARGKGKIKIRDGIHMPYEKK
jgi:hypothetical protein